MSYNGTGTFSINSAGQPVVTGTTITSTAFNTLTADLATGLSTALCKDGQSTPTANIGLGAFKITNLGAGTLATDAARLSQIQSGAATFIVASGTDTILGTGSPALTAYATGNAFQFTVAATNTGAATLNIDSLGAKAITRDGSTALVAGDLVSGSVVTVVYDGTRFQVLNSNSKTNFNLSGTLTAASTATASKLIPTGSSAVGNGMYLPAANSLGFSTNGAEAVRIDSGGNIGINATPSAWFANWKVIQGGSTATGVLTIASTNDQLYLFSNAYIDTAAAFKYTSTNFASYYRLYNAGHTWYSAPSGTAGATATFTQRMDLDGSGNLSIATTNSSNWALGGIVLFANYGGYQAVNIGHASGVASGSAFENYGYNGAIIGSITQSGTTAVLYNTTSDYRLKDVVGAVSGSGARIDALKPIDYKWKADNSQARGFLAHEFQEVYPNSVTGTKDGTKEEEYEITPAVFPPKNSSSVELTPTEPAVMGTRTVPDYQSMQASASELIADLVAELQSLRKRIATLESK